MTFCIFWVRPSCPLVLFKFMIFFFFQFYACWYDEFSGFVIALLIFGLCSVYLCVLGVCVGRHLLLHAYQHTFNMGSCLAQF